MSISLSFILVCFHGNSPPPGILQIVSISLDPLKALVKVFYHTPFSVRAVVFAWGEFLEGGCEPHHMHVLCFELLQIVLPKVLSLYAPTKCLRIHSLSPLSFSATRDAFIRFTFAKAVNEMVSCCSLDIHFGGC